MMLSCYDAMNLTLTSVTPSVSGGVGGPRLRCSKPKSPSSGTVGTVVLQGIV